MSRARSSFFYRGDEKEKEQEFSPLDKSKVVIMQNLDLWWIIHAYAKGKKRLSLYFISLLLSSRSWASWNLEVCLITLLWESLLSPPPLQWALCGSPSSPRMETKAKGRKSQLQELPELSSPKVSVGSSRQHCHHQQQKGKKKWKRKRGLENSSVSNLLAVQIWGPQLTSQHQRKTSGHSTIYLLSRCWGAKMGRACKLTSQPI